MFAQAAHLAVCIGAPGMRLMSLSLSSNCLLAVALMLYASVDILVARLSRAPLHLPMYVDIASRFVLSMSMFFMCSIVLSSGASAYSSTTFSCSSESSFVRSFVIFIT